MGKGYRLYVGVSHFVPIPHPRILTPTRMGLRTNYHIYTVYESPARVRTELYREGDVGFLGADFIKSAYWHYCFSEAGLYQSCAHN